MRSCIFCGSSPVTKEDAWPVWLVEHIGRSRLIASMVGGKRRPYRTDRIVQRVGCACRKCNNGWMSELEGLAKPILLPLVDGRPVQILGIGQAIIAAWMLKTFMVFDSMDRNYWRPSERELIRQRKFGTALGDSLTAAAHYVGAFKAYAHPRRQTVHRLSGEDTGIPVFSGVLAVGKALLWLQHDRYRETTGREGWLWPPKHYDRFALLGGPNSKPVEWPPGHAIDDAALQEFLSPDGDPQGGQR